MPPRAFAGASALAGRRAPRLRRAAAAQHGFTLAEMLVVLAILGVVLLGLTQLFMSATKAQDDQTNRVNAQSAVDQARAALAHAIGAPLPAPPR